MHCSPMQSGCIRQAGVLGYALFQLPGTSLADRGLGCGGALASLPFWPRWCCAWGGRGAVLWTALRLISLYLRWGWLARNRRPEHATV